MSSPLVSIIIPVYNTEAHVALSIQSILAQSFQNWELVIVDDHSTDNTYPICHEIASQDNRIKLFRNEKNLGMMPNWNHALTLINPNVKYWGKLDADDYWDTSMLEKCFDVLESNKQVGMVCGRFIYVDEHNNLIPETEKVYPEWARNKSVSLIPFVKNGYGEMFRYNLVQQGAGLIKKDFIDNHGKYLPIPAGDTELYYRIGAHYKIHFIDQVMHFHRAWSNSFTKTRVLNKFGNSEINLCEARRFIYDYYLKEGLITEKEYRTFISKTQFELNKVLIAQHRLEGRRLSSVKLLVHQFLRNPARTFGFYWSRLTDEVTFKSR